MNHLSIDIETRSSVDLTNSGLYKYAESEDFGILLFAYKWNEDPVQVIDLTKEEAIPAEILFALTDKNTIKHAYNAAFEWFCIRKGIIGQENLPLDQWRCTQAHALYLGYAAGLEATGKAIGLPEEKLKLQTGKALVKYFCTPARATKSNGGRKWNLPEHDPEKWELFKEYNAQDVESEHAILKRLSLFPWPDKEIALWRYDVEMHVKGTRVDKELVYGALSVDGENKMALTEEARNLTKLQNPNSATQLLTWLSAQGIDLMNLQKATVQETLERQDLPQNVRRALILRQQLGKTSVKKYEKLALCRCDDGRVRGLTQYYGASRTGRYSGRLVQVQNLPRNYSHTLDVARRLIRNCNYDAVKMIYGNTSDILSQLIRTAFIPSEGNKFVVADYSAIEARVIAWLAGETWVNEVFATHGKIYEATAAQMFHVPIESISKGQPNYDLRQKGKVATLALGYQGSANALIAMGALQMGIAEEELPDIVSKWRQANPHIVSLWAELEEAAVTAISQAKEVPAAGGIVTFALEGDILYGQKFLTVRLPAGRKLYYAHPSLKANKFGRPAIHYYGIGDNKKWSELNTYGGKLCENIVQSIARDCLCEALLKLKDVVFHVHDEVVIDAPMTLTVNEVCNIMSEPISWAPGLILRAAGFEGEYYQKD